MKFLSCKRPVIIKNKFLSTIIGSLGMYFAIGFILPISYLSVYITSYIKLKQDFVTMHYGFFLNLIMTFAMSASVSIGGLLEHILGFIGTGLFGVIIILIANIFFFNIQNIWWCYFLTLIMGTGAGISISLIGRNLTLYIPNKKGIIVGIVGLITILIAGLFLVSGEKIISYDGFTLEDGQENYPKYIAERTYLYFIIGFFSVPIGFIIFFLFVQKYQHNSEKDDNSNNQSDNEDYNKKIEMTQYGNEQMTSTKDDNDENKQEVQSNETPEKNDDTTKDNNSKTNKISDEIKKLHVKKAIKTLRFWRIALSSFLLSFPVSFMITTGRTFGALIGIKGVALQFLTICQGAGIILVGPFLGILSDKKGPLIILKIASIISIIPGILLTFFIDNTVLYMISFVLIALGLVAKMVSFNPLIMEIFGIEESVILQGIINGFGKISEVITTVAAFVISFYYENDEIKTPYKFIFISGSVCSGLSFILLVFESKTKFDYNDKNDLLIDNSTETKISTNL